MHLEKDLVMVTTSILVYMPLLILFSVVVQWSLLVCMVCWSPPLRKTSTMLHRRCCNDLQSKLIFNKLLNMLLLSILTYPRPSTATLYRTTRTTAISIRLIYVTLLHLLHMNWDINQNTNNVKRTILARPQHFLRCHQRLLGVRRRAVAASYSFHSMAYSRFELVQVEGSPISGLCFAQDLRLKNHRTTWLLYHAEAPHTEEHYHVGRTICTLLYFAAHHVHLQPPQRPQKDEHTMEKTQFCYSEPTYNTSIHVLRWSCLLCAQLPCCDWSQNNEG